MLWPIVILQLKKLSETKGVSVLGQVLNLIFKKQHLIFIEGLLFLLQNFTKKGNYNKENSLILSDTFWFSQILTPYSKSQNNNLILIKLFWLILLNLNAVAAFLTTGHS